MYMTAFDLAAPLAIINSQLSILFAWLPGLSVFFLLYRLYHHHWPLPKMRQHLPFSDTQRFVPLSDFYSAQHFPFLALFCNEFLYIGTQKSLSEFNY